MKRKTDHCDSKNRFPVAYIIIFISLLDSYLQYKVSLENRDSWGREGTKTHFKPCPHISATRQCVSCLHCSQV